MSQIVPTDLVRTYQARPAAKVVVLAAVAGNLLILTCSHGTSPFRTVWALAGGLSFLAFIYSMVEFNAATLVRSPLSKNVLFTLVIPTTILIFLDILAAMKNFSPW